MIEAHIVKKIGNEIEFLLLKRAKSELYPNIWQMVTGSIVQDEKTYVTAYREIIEETGLKPERMWVVPYVNSFYSWRKNHICIVPVFVALVGHNSSVKISDEHSDFKWAKKESAIEYLGWQGQRNSVEIIHQYFTEKNSQFYFEEVKLGKIKLDQINK
jgi:8-oxo-dGTP pyrophosphatase MutT (NUDIX family)